MHLRWNSYSLSQSSNDSCFFRRSPLLLDRERGGDDDLPLPLFCSGGIAVVVDVGAGGAESELRLAGDIRPTMMLPVPNPSLISSSMNFLPKSVLIFSTIAVVANSSRKTTARTSRQRNLVRRRRRRMRLNFSSTSLRGIILVWTYLHAAYGKEVH